MFKHLFKRKPKCSLEVVLNIQANPNTTTAEILASLCKVVLHELNELNVPVETFVEMLRK